MRIMLLEQQKMWLRCIAIGVVYVAAVAAAVTHASAQAYPSKPIKIIVGAPAGTGPDIEVRQLVPQLSAELGQPVVVENKPGLAGLIGAELAAKAAPDGYTILGATISNAASHPRLYDRPSFNVEKDLVPISLSIRHPWLLYVRGALPAATFKDFIALAKSKPDTITFASNGIGGTQHLSMELLQVMTGIKLKHIPYGTGPWSADLIAGQIDTTAWPLITMTEHLQSGKIRALAISNGGKPSDQAPGVPQFADVGLPAFDMTVWAGLLAPAGTPKEIVDKLAAAAAKAAQGKAYREFAAKIGATAVGSTPAEFAAFLATERARWKKVIADAGVKLE